jgi:hypothetical protein
MQYDLQPLLMDTLTAGAGSVAHDPDAGCAVLSVGTSLGDKVTRQSRQYTVYQPGKSQLIFATGTLGEAQEGCSKRIGYFDDFNGVFYELTGDGMFLVFRSSVTGVTVDERIPQSDWNVDRFDGLAPNYTPQNGTALDPTKSQIFAFDLQWLGVGRVRAGMDFDGKLCVAHQFFNDNRKPATYWTTAALPVRYEIENTAATAQACEMLQICCSVQSEGGLDVGSGFVFGASSTTTRTAGTGGLPLLSIRPKTLFNGITNHSGIIPIAFDLITASQNVFIEIVYDGALTGASWSDVDGNSAVEFDEGATAISGGTVVYRGFAATTSGNKGAQLAQTGIPTLLWLTNSIAGNDTTPLTIVVRSFSASASVVGALTWRELR